MQKMAGYDIWKAIDEPFPELNKDLNSMIKSILCILSIIKINQHLDILCEIAEHKVNPKTYKTMTIREQQILSLATKDGRRL